MKAIEANAARHAANVLGGGTIDTMKMKAKAANHWGTLFPEVGPGGSLVEPAYPRAVK